MEFKLDKFFFNTPLYEAVFIDDLEQEEFKALFYSGETYFEGYNPWKKIESTFSISKTMANGLIWKFISDGGFGSIEIKCKRYGDIFRFYIYWSAEKNFLLKI